MGGRGTQRQSAALADTRPLSAQTQMPIYHIQSQIDADHTSLVLVELQGRLETDELSLTGMPVGTIDMSTVGFGRRAFLNRSRAALYCLSASSG